MEREPIIFGKKEKKEEIKNELQEQRRDALRPLKEEIKKTQEEIKFINLANSWLKEEFEEIGVEEKPDIRPESIHFLPREEFKEVCLHKDFMAFTSFLENNIYIDKTAPRNRLELYVTILHEAVHVSAFEKIYVEKSGEKFTIDQYRRGYRIQNPAEENHEHFRGLGEAIVDKTVIEIINKHREEAIKELNITPEEEKSPVSYCSGFMDILDVVIRKVARNKGEDEKTVWREFKKGQFTGRMTHLKDVERTFGKGSLRVLAALYTKGSLKSLPPEKINRKILRYFETDDENERDKIVDEVLSEQERLRYQKRREFAPKTRQNDFGKRSEEDKD